MNQRRTRVTTPNQRRRFRVWWIIAFGVPVIAFAGFLIYQLLPLDAPVPDDAGAAYIGLERGFTVQGFPRLGSVDAPILIEEFTSYACPHCREFHEDRFPDLIDEIADGTVQFVLIPVPHVGPGADNAAQGAFCAGQQNAFWTMHDVLFDWQKRFITRTFDEQRINDGAAALGLDVAAFEACMDGDAAESFTDAARLAFNDRGLTGTPSFFINGERIRDYREFDNLDDYAG